MENLKTKLKLYCEANSKVYEDERYDDNIVADVVEVEDGKTKDGKVKVGGKGGLTRATGVGATGLGGLMMDLTLTLIIKVDM